MGDHPWAGKLSQYVTSHPGLLSLAIPPWVGAMTVAYGLRGEGLVWLIGAVVCLSCCSASPIVRLGGQWMAA